jgi:hypothetical protein
VLGAREHFTMIELGLGWHCLHAYGPYRVQETPFGPLDFEGGVLVYRNPRFLHGQRPG